MHVAWTGDANYSLHPVLYDLEELTNKFPSPLRACIRSFRERGGCVFWFSFHVFPASDSDDEPQPTEPDYTLRPNIKIDDLGELRTHQTDHADTYTYAYKSLTKLTFTPKVSMPRSVASTRLFLSHTATS